MSLSRFRCYIEGGQIEGMKRPCVGLMDRSEPREMIWKTFPHRLFFARDRTATWGPPSYDMSHPLFDLTALEAIQTEKCISVESVQNGWYHNVLYLGKEREIPILTMTCTLSDVDSFVSGKFSINPHAKSMLVP
ncbi:hypothetical protein OROGR_029282 [Orobanche gracilis]